MNLLITGGLGQVGLALASVAVGQGAGRVVTLGRSEVPPSMTLPGSTIHEVGDVGDPDRLEDLLPQHAITHLVHAAGARTSACEREPLTAVEGNIVGTDRVFHAARRVGTIERTVFFSTAAVYGKVAERIAEDYPVAPQNNYAISKAAAELSARGHTSGASFTTAIVRPGFVIGPEVVGAQVRSRFLDVIGEAMTSAEVEFAFPERFFVHAVRDLGSAVLALLNLDQVEPVEVYHLPGRCLTVEVFSETLTEVLAQCGYQKTISPVAQSNLPLPENLDFSKFTRVCGTSPLSDLPAVLAEMVGRARPPE